MGDERAARTVDPDRTALRSIIAARRSERNDDNPLREARDHQPVGVAVSRGGIEQRVTDGPRIERVVHRERSVLWEVRNVATVEFERLIWVERLDFEAPAHVYQCNTSAALPGRRAQPFAAGRNLGSATSSLACSKVTSSGIPISSSSFGQSITFDIILGPSSSSTIAMLYGTSSANAGS